MMATNLFITGPSARRTLHRVPGPVRLRQPLAWIATGADGPDGGEMLRDVVQHQAQVAQVMAQRLVAEVQ
jgi:hypothetical protein